MYERGYSSSDMREGRLYERGYSLSNVGESRMCAEVMNRIN